MAFNEKQVLLKSASAKRTEGQRVFALVVLVLLAFFRWLPGGDPLNPTTGVRAFVEVGFLGLAILLALFWWPRRLSFALVKGWWLLLPAFWAGLSTLWSPNPLLTLAKAGELFLVHLLALVISQGSLTLTDWLKKTQVSLLLILLLGFGLNVVYYGTPFYYGPPLGGLLAGESDRPRLTLAADHPLVVGHLFALLLFVSAALLRGKGWFSSGGLIMLSVWGLFTTQARASTVATGAALMWWVLRALGKRLGRLRILLETAVVMVALGIAATLFPEAVDATSTYTPDVYTLNGRIPLWQATVEALFADFALLFLGTGFEATRYLTFDLAYWNPGHTHNGFLEIIAGLGLPGLLFYLPLIVFVVRSMWRPSIASALSFYILFMAVFNPVFQPGMVWFLILTTLLMEKKGAVHAYFHDTHILPTARR